MKHVLFSQIPLRLCLFCLLSLPAIGASGQDVIPPLSTDRPDATESPFTVPAEQWQLEMDVWVYERDDRIPGSSGESRESWAFAIHNLKYGLTDRLDIQAILEPYRRETVESKEGERITVDGFGDLTLRLKWRLTEPGGSSDAAWAVLPYVKLPTAKRPLGNGAVEGGFVVPYARTLSDAWSFGFQGGAEWRRLDREADRAYSLTPITTVVFGQSLTETVGIFYEIAAAYDTEASTDAWEVTFNTGATYALGPDVQLDLGVFLGLTRAAPDLTLFTGYSHRW